MAGRRMFGGAPIHVNQKGRFMSTIAKALRHALLRAVLPPTCCLCGAQSESRARDLCGECVNCLPLIEAPGSGASPLFVPTLVRVVVPFHYAYPVDHWIRALKFSGERVYARVLAALLADAFRALRQEPPELLVPIPLHVSRYRQRGFNQAAEIARFAAAELGLAVDSRCLARKKSTLEQSSLSVARRRTNVRGAFAAVRSIGAKRVALVDDVLTTGSTALAAAQALLESGVREVELWAAARVLLD
jgi:ComF family protein